MRWLLLTFSLSALLNCSGGSSTDTDNFLTDNSSTNTDNAIVSLTELDSTQNFDSAVTIAVASSEESGTEEPGTKVYVVENAPDNLGDLGDTILATFEKDTVENIDFYQVDSGVLVVLQDSQGKPQEGVEITLREANEVPDSSVNVSEKTYISDSNGVVLIPEITQGDYVLQAEDSSESILFVTDLTVTGYQVQYTSFAPAPESEFSGRLIRESGLSPEGIRVYILGTNLETLTDSTGTFNFGLLSIEDPHLGIEFIAPSPPTMLDSTKEGDMTGIMNPLDSNQVCPLQDLTSDSLIVVDRVDTNSPENSEWVIRDLDTDKCEAVNVSNP